MVFIAVRTDFTALTVQKTQMFAQETTSSMQDCQGLKAAGDAAVIQLKSSKKRTKKKKNKVAVQVPVLEFSSDVADVVDVDSNSGIAPNGNADEGGGGGSVSYKQVLQQNSSGNICTLGVFDQTQDHSQTSDRTATSSSPPSAGLHCGESYEKSAPNSYAAAVSGRKYSDSLEHSSGTSFFFGESPTAFPSMMSSYPLKKSSSTNSLRALFPELRKEFRDVGVQVSETSTLESKEKSKDFECQATMTGRKIGHKSKSVVAKLCGCCSDDKFIPPVEFHGDCFSFEKTIANQVSQMGITFFDEIEENLSSTG